MYSYLTTGVERVRNSFPMLLLLLPVLLFVNDSCRRLPAEQTAEDQVGEGLGIYARNPAYWTFRGQPQLLIGGSKDDNLFQIDHLEVHLDSLAAAGGNYIRNTLSSRDTGNIWAFARNDDGLYDLDQFAPAYFQRFADLLRLTAERDIVVQIELWDRFDYARDPWLRNPFRPANNINFDTLESGLTDLYPRHPGRNDNPFFFTVPALDSHALLLPYQQKYVDKVLEVSLPYNHVLYCMDNETNGDPAWGAYWAGYLKERASAMGKRIFTTEMWDAWDLKKEEHRATFDHPELYDFVDISQNNHNKGQEHWDNLHWVRQYTANHKRPLNHVKIYGAPTSRFGSGRDAVERFWRSLLGGAASIRFHRPPSGLGLSGPVVQSLQAARLLLDAYPVMEARPDISSDKMREREPNEAYLSYSENGHYVMYFPDGGQVELDLTAESGEARLQWLNILESPAAWKNADRVEGGGFRKIVCPGAGHWLAMISFEEE